MERVQQAVQNTHPIAAGAVGASTATYAWIEDISNIVEFIGVTSGSILSVCLLIQFAIVNIKKLRKK